MQFNVGDRVFAEATLFDGKNNNNSWSFSVFGDKFDTAVCHGVIKLIVGDTATVLWDIDNSEMPIKMNLLNKKNGDVNQKNKRKRVNIPKKNTKNARSDLMPSTSVVENIYSLSEFGETSSESSDSEDEDSSDDLNGRQNVIQDCTAIEENLITAHDTTWKFWDEKRIDQYTDTKYKPKLNVDNPVQNMSELDFWLLFFPIENIDTMLEATNRNLGEDKKQCTKNEFFKVIGMFYAMSTNVLHSRREYWSTKDDELFPPPAFGKRFGLGYHRFEEILQSLAFSVEDIENEDKWKSVKPFIDMLHIQWNDIFKPGYKLCIDESIFSWYGRGNYDPDGMPAVIKIKRKPKGIGCECKTLADVESHIMLRLEINEGKELMAQKKWQKDLGAGTATTLRLTEPWHGSGRIIVGDSWFASVKTAVELHKRGLYFVGIVKTATKQFPLKTLKEKCPENSGGTVYATATVDNVKLLSVGWKDKKFIPLLGVVELQ